MRYFFICFSLFALLASPALAQSKKELAAQNAQLAQRLSQLENRMLTGDPAAERLMQRMDALETAQRSITGEVERLRYERDTLQEEVRALATNIANLQTIADDMKLHLKAVNVVASRAPAPVQAPSSSNSIVYGGRSGGGVYQNGSSIGGPPTISGMPQTTSPAIPSNDMQELAQVGLDKMQEGDFTAAQSAFHQYLELNADAADRGDVYYWLGETYYVKSGYADAADAYIASMRAQPNGKYAPDAMVRLAATARALGQKEMACQTLASFPVQYPNASSAVRDKARLETQRSGC